MLGIWSFKSFSRAVSASQCRHHQTTFSFVWVNEIWTKEVNSVPYWPVYTVLTSKPIQIPLLFRTEKNTDHTGYTGKIQLFRPVNAYRTETRKRRRKKKFLTLSSLHSLVSLAVSQTHSAWSFLSQIPDLLDWHSPSLFQIYFLFPLSWLRPM